MPTDDLFSELKEAAVRAIGAFDPRLLTDATDPFIGTRRRITGFSGFPAFETARINILPATKKRAKQADLLGWQRRIADH
jgi:hypothetical protein